MVGGTVCRGGLSRSLRTRATRCGIGCSGLFSLGFDHGDRKRIQPWQRERMQLVTIVRTTSSGQISWNSALLRVILYKEAGALNGRDKVCGPRQEFELSDFGIVDTDLKVSACDAKLFGCSSHKTDKQSRANVEGRWLRSSGGYRNKRKTAFDEIDPVVADAGYDLFSSFTAGMEIGAVPPASKCTRSQRRKRL